MNTDPITDEEAFQIADLIDRLRCLGHDNAADELEQEAVARLLGIGAAQVAKCFPFKEPPSLTYGRARPRWEHPARHYDAPDMTGGGRRIA